MIVSGHLMNLPSCSGSAGAVNGAADRSVDSSADGGEEAETGRLVERARLGDTEAFTAVVARFEKRAFHFVLRMLENTHDAEDVTQETFVKVWHSLPRYRPRHRFSTWLFTIARRTALNHLRSRRPVEEIGNHDPPAEGNPSEAAADREEAMNVWIAARGLPREQYEALWLCYGEGFAVNETARILNTNPVRMRVLLHRARRRLADQLQPR